MNNNDIIIVIWYGLSILIVSGFGLYKLITEDKNEIVGNWMLFIVGLTPGNIIITGIGFICIIMYIIIVIPSNLIKRLKS